MEVVGQGHFSERLEIGGGFGFQLNLPEVDRKMKPGACLKKTVNCYSLRKDCKLIGYEKLAEARRDASHFPRALSSDCVRSDPASKFIATQLAIIHNSI